MLTEKQVRARIKECKLRIKFSKSAMSYFSKKYSDVCNGKVTINDNTFWLNEYQQNFWQNKEVLLFHKEKLKRLRRELPMRLTSIFGEAIDYGVPYDDETFICPICGKELESAYNYCPHCGQRVRE